MTSFLIEGVIRMSVIRVVKNQNYTVMSNIHLREKDMSLKAKGLLSMVLALPDTWNYSIAGLVSICKENETAIRSALNELKDFGYLKVIKKTSDKTETGRFEYEYIFYENPENPALENLYVENPHVENPLQLNTKLLNTKKINTNNIILGETEVPPHGIPQQSVKSYRDIEDGTACLDTLPPPPQTPPPPSKHNILDKIEKKQKSNKTKEQKRELWINKCIKLCDKFDFTDEVLESLETYFNYLSDLGTQFPSIVIELQLQKLSEIPSKSQKIAIMSTISRGWKSIEYVLDQMKKSDFSSYHINGNENSYTVEENQAWYDEMKRRAEKNNGV